MNPDDRLLIFHVLDARRDEIADRWYASIRQTGFTHLGPALVRRQLRVLTEEAIAALLSEPFERQRAEAVGSSLAQLHYVQPEALGATQELLAHQLLLGLTPPQAAVMQPRLAMLLGSVATGYFAESRAMILEEQEQIRRALFDARLQAEAARAAAEAALQVRNDFLSAVSHDLQTPLTAIRGRAQILQRLAASLQLPESDAWTRQLVSIDDAAARMGRMIDDLMDLTRLQAGQSLQLDRQATDLVSLARQVVDEYQHTTSRHRISLETTVPDLIGVWDRHRLERVLANLLSNAIKYSPHGGNIALAVYPQGQVAHLEVRDQGEGISAADLPRIFDWFHRGRHVSGATGMGIGLAVVRQIVEQHGGTITVHSQPGAGTTVVVQLPLADEESITPQATSWG